jgi:hypothetical protein
VRYENVCQYERVRLPDGDLIDVSVESDWNYPYTLVELELGSDVSSWKGISIEAPGYFAQDRLWVEGSRTYSRADFHTDFWRPDTGQALYLRKRKGFWGTKTSVYKLTGLGNHVGPGQRVKLRWVED